MKEILALSSFYKFPSLQKRRNKHKLVIFYKIPHGIAPTYLSDIVPPLIQDTTTYNLRNAGNIQNYRVHTNLFSNSFFPSTVRAWNDLPNDIKDALSVGSFKYKINKNLRSSPKFIMLEHAKVKYYRQDYEWSVVP